MGVNEIPGASFGEPGGDPLIISAANEYLLIQHQNLPNHSATRDGRGKFVTQQLSEIPLFREKQDAFRYAAWLITLAEKLPDVPEESGVTFEQVLDAVHNS